MRERININHQIRAAELRVVDEAGANLGVLSLSAALALALEQGQDLIEISPTARPPVAKIMDYGKFQYLSNKKNKSAKTKTAATETKSIQIKIGTGDHDLSIKAGKVSDFLKEGHRVKVELFLSGRAKYFEAKFLEERLARVLKFITENYRVADGPVRGPRGLSVIIERIKGQKETNSHENQQVISEEVKVNPSRQSAGAPTGQKPL
ncbi:MAG: translation initiation factor IF-3 [Patescibacteria group bacterium]